MSTMDTGPPTEVAHFVMVPEVILLDPSLSMGAKLTWAVLKKYARQSGVTWISLETIAAGVSRSKRWVQSYLKELEDAGHIRREAQVKTGPGKKWLPVHTHLLTDVRNGEVWTRGKSTSIGDPHRGKSSADSRWKSTSTETYENPFRGSLYETDERQNAPQEGSDRGEPTEVTALPIVPALASPPKVGDPFMDTGKPETVQGLPACREPGCPRWAAIPDPLCWVHMQDTEGDTDGA